MRVTFPAKPRILEGEWHYWYAWHPVKMNIDNGELDDYRWLERVMRCGYTIDGMFAPVTVWYYKEIVEAANEI